MASDADRPLLRIGELSRRSGVSDHVLRAWESRYQLLRPVRTAGGFRLYSEADAARVHRMQQHLAGGLSAAEAARAVLRDAPAGDDGRTSLAAGPPDLASVADLAAALRRALDAFDEPAADGVLDRLISDLSLPAVLREVVMPYLAELGDRWGRGTASVAQEHFASQVIRGRLAGFAHGWGRGQGPLAVLACPPGELHDIALMVFGIVLNRAGWRIHYLGPSTPVEEMVAVATLTRPQLVVVAATVPGDLATYAPQLTTLSASAPLALAGAGATQELAAAVGARLLTDDPVTAAERVAGLR